MAVVRFLEDILEFNGGKKNTAKSSTFNQSLISMRRDSMQVPARIDKSAPLDKHNMTKEPWNHKLLVIKQRKGVSPPNGLRR